jgi:hypothetical protein
MCTKREFLVKVKKENYAELLRVMGELSIGNDSLIEKNISLPDTKETYELLVKSGLVEDWSLVEKETPLIKRGIDPIKSGQDEEEEIVKSIPLFGDNKVLLIEYLTNLTPLYIESRKKSPGLRFTYSVFRREITDKMIGTVTFDAHVNILSDFMRGYYQFEEPWFIAKDYIHRLKECWGKVEKDDNLLTLAEKMFETKLLF